MKRKTKSLGRKTISFLGVMLLIVTGFAANIIVAHWGTEDGHKMHYPQLPQGDYGYSIKAGRPNYDFKYISKNSKI
ncbi:MAG: hypothetical protein PVF58_11910 [Candidatus Methanofastidiosia archaeon]|jgi:hypothetical protein